MYYKNPGSGSRLEVRRTCYTRRRAVEEIIGKLNKNKEQWSEITKYKKTINKALNIYTLSESSPSEKEEYRRAKLSNRRKHPFLDEPTKLCRSNSQLPVT